LNAFEGSLNKVPNKFTVVIKAKEKQKKIKKKKLPDS
jgi:hypothetical protein